MNAEELMNHYQAMALGEQNRFDMLHAQATGHRKSTRRIAATVMGHMTSEARAAASRRNGALGGRPKKAA